LRKFKHKKSSDKQLFRQNPHSEPDFDILTERLRNFFRVIQEDGNMTQEEAEFKQAITLIKGGNKSAAVLILKNILKANELEYASTFALEARCLLLANMSQSK